MSEFTYLFRGRETAASPEQMQKTMEKWVAWFKELGTKGHIKDPGHPLAPTGRTVTGKQKIITDGPYAEAKDLVGGYMVVEAENLGKHRKRFAPCQYFNRCSRQLLPQNSSHLGRITFLYE